VCICVCVIRQCKTGWFVLKCVMFWNVTRAPDVIAHKLHKFEIPDIRQGQPVLFDDMSAQLPGQQQRFPVYRSRLGVSSKQGLSSLPFSSVLIKAGGVIKAKSFLPSISERTRAPSETPYETQTQTQRTYCSTHTHTHTYTHAHTHIHTHTHRHTHTHVDVHVDHASLCLTGGSYAFRQSVA